MKYSDKRYRKFCTEEVDLIPNLIKIGKAYLFLKVVVMVKKEIEVDRYCVKRKNSPCDVRRPIHHTLETYRVLFKQDKFTYLGSYR